MYNRVAPRDMFSEANFLKCLAQMVKLIESGELKNVTFSGNFAPEHLPFDMDGSSGDLMLDGDMFCVASSGEPITLFRGSYSKQSWPIHWIDDDEEEYFIFNDDGSLSVEFLERLGEGQITQEVGGQSELMFCTANLLKCMAKLSLDSIPGVNLQFKKMWFNEKLYASQNLSFKEIDGYLISEPGYFEANGEPLQLAAKLNSKSIWPMVILRGNVELLTVFDENGEYTSEFLEHIDVEI